MEYRFSEDLRIILSILGMTQSELAKELGIQQVTVSRSVSGDTRPSDKLLEKVYGYAYGKNIMLNRLKSMYWSDNSLPGHMLLFHGAKSSIDGIIDISHSRGNNDFGRGFYCGQNYSQAISFISGFDKSCVYLLDFNPENLSFKEFELNQEWMLTIAYFRGTLDSYRNHPVVRRLADEAECCDFVIAPIADNRMYQIINSFINGEITDEQCMHCLASTDLGKQIVFKSERAVRNLRMVERMYVSSGERDFYRALRSDASLEAENKVKQARIQYRGKGQYIDEILE